MKRNPLKWQSQAKAWAPTVAAIRRDIKALSKRYKTVPLVAGVVKTKVAEPVVFAIKVGKALSADAFTVLADAQHVAQLVADRYQMPVHIVNKKTKQPAATVSPKPKARPKKKAPAGFAVNPMGARSYFLHPDDGLIVADLNLTRLRKFAAQVATQTGKKIVIHSP